MRFPDLLLEEIERLMQEVKGVCDSIAHDLRTPLTRLLAGLERARRRARSTEEYAAGWMTPSSRPEACSGRSLPAQAAKCQGEVNAVLRHALQQVLGERGIGLSISGETDLAPQVTGLSGSAL